MPVVAEHFLVGAAAFVFLKDQRNGRDTPGPGACHHAAVGLHRSLRGGDLPDIVWRRMKPNRMPFIDGQ